MAIAGSDAMPQARVRAERWYDLGSIGPMAVGFHESGLALIPRGEPLVAVVVAPGVDGDGEGIPAARVAPYVHFGMFRPSKRQGRFVFRFASYCSIPAIELGEVEARVEKTRRWWAPWTFGTARRLAFLRDGSAEVVLAWRHDKDQSFRALMKPTQTTKLTAADRFDEVAEYARGVISTLQHHVAESFNAFGSSDTSLSPHRFEMAVTEQLRRLGATVRHTGQTGDGGVDIEATYNGELYVVQCKRFERPVGSPALRDLIGTVHMQRARLGLLISISGFSNAARQAALDQPIRLFEARELASAQSLDDLL